LVGPRYCGRDALGEPNPLIEFNMGCKRVSTNKPGVPLPEAIGDDLRDWAMIGLIVFAVSLLMWLSLLGSLDVMSLPLPR
jgi:hypothetical protein